MISCWLLNLVFITGTLGSHDIHINYLYDYILLKKNQLFYFEIRIFGHNLVRNVHIATTVYF